MALSAGIHQSSRLAPGQQHRDTVFVAAIVVAEEIDQIAFFQEDSDEDVGRGHRREQQMPGRHDSSGPECDDETKVDRVTHELVVKRGAETRFRHRMAGQVAGDLMQPEQFEVVDQERARQYDQPADQ